MKLKKYITLILILSFILSPINLFSATGQIKTTDLSDYNFQEEIIVPFDTSLDKSKYQPVDLKINFDNPCYAIDELDHSVRIACDTGSEIIELESQIYNLKKTDDTHISSCNIVFLIPKEADGKEKYYVFYDSDKTNLLEYEDHLELSDSSYFYEPISGQKIVLDYFGIKEKDNYVYGIVQTGELLGNPIAFSVVRFKPESKVVETYNIDQLGIFDMRYGINSQPGYEGTSWAEKVEKTVLVDGNLMVRVRLKGKSPKGDLLSDNIYTYYHSPTENKRIVVDCYHEVLKDVKVPEPSIIDGTYGGIVSIKSRSSTIEKMNVGDILPELYIYTEDETINDYPVPQNPNTVERDAVVSTEDDMDVGKKAWVCSNDLEDKKMHGLILDSNMGFTDDENDGVQVKAWVKENIKLPGLEADSGNLYLARNSYENGEHSPNLKKDFDVNYKLEFFTLFNEEIESINKKSEIFQEQSKLVPALRENITEKQTEKKERYTLTTFVHMAPSFPLGSLLSAATGKKLPYIYAELYKENDFKSSGSVNRLSLGSVELDLEGKTILGKIQTILGIFDFKNSSIFKKIVFPDIEKGIYVVKIFRENPFFSDERVYIGYGVVDLNENKSMRIKCTAESKAEFSIKDQEGKGVENVDFLILSNDNIISNKKTDKNGTIELNAPADFRDKYQLKVMYKGFLVNSEEIKLGYINHFKPFSKDFKIDLFDLKVKLVDKWGFIPDVDVNLFVTSNEMVEQTTISSEKIDRKNYIFKNLVGSNYDLTLKYKSFELEKNVKLDKDKTIDLVFPAEYKTKLNVLNLVGDSVSSGKIIISRNNKKIESKIDSDGQSSFTVPPGKYNIEVFIDETKVAYQDLDIKSTKTLDIVSDSGSFTHMIITVLCIIGIISSLAYLFYKKKYFLSLKILVIFLLIISVFQPWWVLTGEENSITTNTKTFLYPSRMISFTESNEGMGGSISMLPEELTSLLTILSVIILLSVSLIFLSIVFKNKLNKTSKGLIVLSTILIIATLGLFYYALSLVTEIGVGSFMGSGEVMTTISGVSEGVLIDCSWGPGIGFYLAVISLFLVFIPIILKKFKPSFK